jgi:hypothetical protein
MNGMKEEMQELYTEGLASPRWPRTMRRRLQGRRRSVGEGYVQAGVGGQKSIQFTRRVGCLPKDTQSQRDITGCGPAGWLIRGHPNWTDFAALQLIDRVEEASEGPSTSQTDRSVPG